jgi:hypothetical protein
VAPALFAHRLQPSLSAFNRAFKEARAAEPRIKYVDYLEARKAPVLEPLAKVAIRG